MRASREEVRRILALLLLLPTGPASETLHLSVIDKDGRRYREESGANLVGEIYNKDTQVGERKKEQMENGREKQRRTSIRSLTCETRQVH